MVNPNDDTWERIARLAEDIAPRKLSQLWKKQELTLTTRTDLVSDLDLVGDDAMEFMDKYVTEFPIKPGDYDPWDYFDKEGLWILPTFKKQKEKMHITLGMLYLAAKIGEWDSARLNQAYLNDQFE